MNLRMEKELLCLRASKSMEDHTEVGDILVEQILRGEYADVLQSADIRQLLKFGSEDLWKSWDLEAIATCVSSSVESGGQSARESLLLSGVAALCLFAQANWTGPEGNWDEIPVKSSDEERTRCLSRLSVDGSDVYQLLRCPEALAVARVVFEGCQDRLSTFPSFPLWRIRYCLLYQQVLDESAPHLFNLFLKDTDLSSATRALLDTSAQVAVEHYLTVANIYNRHHHATETADFVARAQRVLRLSLRMVGAMGRRTYFQESKPQLALRVSDTEPTPSDDRRRQVAPPGGGAENTETTPGDDRPEKMAPPGGGAENTEDAPSDDRRRQVAPPGGGADNTEDMQDRSEPAGCGAEDTEDAPSDDRRRRVAPPGGGAENTEDMQDRSEPAGCGVEDTSEPAGCRHLPADLRLADDTRMERVQYDDPTLHPAASPLRQAVILSKFFQEMRAQGRSDIRDEQLLVMLGAVTHQPQMWAVQLSALLQRSRLESDQRRTVERAMTQTQALVDAVSRPDPAVAHRLQLFFCTHLPTRWQMEAQLAARYLAMGVTKAALEVYERLQLWEEAIQCYHLLQQRQRAAEVVRQQIAVSGETPKLLCLLGDATDDVALYQRAWLMSDHKFVRAIRSEGLYFYHRKQYERCIPLLRRAVEMNSLQSDVWSRLAFAALEAEDWKTCATAYRRCCYLEPDNFEAWNNIAHAYIKLDQKERAWKTLQEALKYSFDNWKIWENFLVVSVDIGEFEEALAAYSRLADVRDRHVDGPVLRVLVGAVLDDVPDRRGVGAGRLRRKVAALLGRLTAQVTTNATLWALYGDLSASDASEEGRFRTVQRYQRAHGCVARQPAAEKHAQLAAQLLQLAVKLAAAALRWADSTGDGSDGSVLQTLASAKLAVRATITKVKNAQTDPTGQITEHLRSSFKEAETALQDVLDAIQCRQGS